MFATKVFRISLGIYSFCLYETKNWKNKKQMVGPPPFWQPWWSGVKGSIRCRCCGRRCFRCQRRVFDSLRLFLGSFWKVGGHWWSVARSELFWVRCAGEKRAAPQFMNLVAKTPQTCFAGVHAMSTLLNQRWFCAVVWETKYAQNMHKHEIAQWCWMFLRKHGAKYFHISGTMDAGYDPQTTSNN